MRYARVRIAPLERWCKDAREYFAGHESRLVGRPIYILPSAMQMIDGERNWPIGRADLRWICTLNSAWANFDNMWVCESMLEMD